MPTQLPPLKRLRRSFFRRDPALVAAELIGHGMVRRNNDEWIGGRIVETEAYLSAQDPASHSRSGPTKRCHSMFADAGTLYVYTIHAKYCLNIVTEKQGFGSAVLIRAIEPLWGVETMKRIRGYDDIYRLMRGPAMLCQSLSINTQQDGLDLITSDEIVVTNMSSGGCVVASSPRIGISRGQDLLLRFYEVGSAFVSRPTAQKKAGPIEGTPHTRE